MSKAQYYTDHKHLVVCVLKVSQNGFHELASGTFVGKAYCNPSDGFDFEKGKSIAYKRALIKLKSAEKEAHEYYLNLLQESHDLYVKHLHAYRHQTRTIDQVKCDLEELLYT